MDASAATIERTFRVWQTVRIGIHKSADEAGAALLAAGYTLSSRASQMLSRVTYTLQEVDVDLALVGVSELSRSYCGEDLDGLIYCGLNAGLWLCPPEIASTLRLTITEQPYFQHLYMIMEPVACDEGDKRIFCLAHTLGGRTLFGRHAPRSPDNLEGQMCIFVIGIRPVD